jgi:hypothetical protein
MSHVSPPEYPVYLISGLLLTHFPLTVFLVWKWPDSWSVVLAFAALSFWMALCAWFVSWQAVIGDWL